MSKKKRKVGLSEVKRIDSRCPKPVGIRELMEWVIARDLTLEKWRKQMHHQTVREVWRLGSTNAV